MDMAFRVACSNRLGIIILEDMDSLTKETQVTRAALLSQLDGLEPKEGLLVLATTNNPEDIDPALAQRPSRFDRVWRFDLPDLALRRRYLNWALTGIGPETVAEIAEKTSGWSFAYLNELRTTAAILSVGKDQVALNEEVLLNAYDLLASQFRSGKKNHTMSNGNGAVGFTPAVSLRPAPGLSLNEI